MSRHFSTNGFTLVELLVSISIVGVVTTTILLNQSSYTRTAALTAAADELASRISEAQAYGIAVKERSPGTSDFSSAYGVAVSVLAGDSPTSYILFVDRNSNQRYDGTWACVTGGTSECLEKITFTNGTYIAEICNIRTNGTTTCGATKRFDVTFTRPSLEAAITFYNSSGNPYAPANLAGAQVALNSPTSLVRYLSVYFSGQISVYSTSL